MPVFVCVCAMVWNDFDEAQFLFIALSHFFSQLIDAILNAGQTLWLTINFVAINL